MKKIWLIIWIIVSCAEGTSAQTRLVEAEKALQTLQERKELYFSIPSIKLQDLKPVERFLSIDLPVQGDRVFIYANGRGFNRFLETNIDFRLETPPSLIREATMAATSCELKNWNVWPSYDQYLSLMNQLASQHPGICQLFSIGQSIQGRDILVLKISDQPGQDEPEPEFLYTSSIHGDELTGFSLLLRLADTLLSGYGADPELTALVDGMEIFINPLANPDGTYAGGNQTVNGATRFNANGIDLNRNYPDPEDGLHPDGEPWQPENILMMNFMRDRHFVLAASFHGGSEVVNYPWDTWSRLHPDNDWYAAVSRRWADTVHANAVPELPGYMTFLNNGITNGYAWYSIDGGRGDYANYFQFMREFLVEISNEKLPSAGNLPAYWLANHRSLIQYMKEAGLGIRGMITDSLTNLPVTARIEIPGHDLDNSEVHSSGEGNYHRLVIPGQYTLRFSAGGYQTRSIGPIEVLEGIPTVVDVKLKPLPAAQTFPGLDATIRLVPNPVSDDAQIEINLKKSDRFDLEIWDGLGRMWFVKKDLLLNQGLNTFHLPAADLSPGVYFCRLVSPNGSAQIRFSRT